MPSALEEQLSHSSRTYRMGMVLGISVGGLFLLTGAVLIILGLTGSIEWVFEGAGFKSRITNASPGVFFALMGMIILWRYKPDISDLVDIGPGRISYHGKK